MKRYENLLKFMTLIFILAASYSNIFAYVVNQTTEEQGHNIMVWFTDNATYYINPSGGPTGNVAAFQEAMVTWNNVPNSYFAFEYGGTTVNTSHAVNDWVNLVSYGPMGLTGTLAENYWFYDVDSGEIVESDIKFNTDYPWATNGSQSAFDVQNVGTHELGHSVSLDDLYNVADSEKTMYWSADEGETKKRTLDQDEIDGKRYCYPTFPPGNAMVPVTPPEYYYTLQGAYIFTTGDTILIQALTFYEDLLCFLDRNITLRGGYDVNYSGDRTYTTIKGILTITNGTLVVDRLIIR